MGLARELKKKTMEHESDGDMNYGWYSRYSHQKIIKGTARLGNKRMSGDHPINSIVEIGQNTKESAGDLRRFAVTQPPVENPTAYTNVKNSQMSKMIIIIISDLRPNNCPLNENINMKSCKLLATVVEGYPKASFSIAATLRCRGGRYSFPWNAPLYTWNVPYNAEC